MSGVESPADTDAAHPEFLRRIAAEGLVPPPARDINRRASDEAMVVLDEMADASQRVARVAERCRGDRPRGAVGAPDYQAVLERSNGALALYSWGSGGVDIYGWRGEVIETDRPVDRWQWDQLINLRGGEPVTLTQIHRRTFRDQIHHTDPTVVLRESTELPPLDECENLARRSGNE